MKCPHCGSGTRMHVQAAISAPGELAHQFSKKNLRSKEVYLMGVLWETADYICASGACGKLVLDGYGNYVTGLKKRVTELEAVLASCLEITGEQKYKKVSTLADLRSLDAGLVTVGYTWGIENSWISPHCNRSFWHGWRNAQIDKGRIPPDAESAALAKEVVASMNESLK